MAQQGIQGSGLTSEENGGTVLVQIQGVGAYRVSKSLAARMGEHANGRNADGTEQEFSITNSVGTWHRTPLPFWVLA